MNTNVSDFDEFLVATILADLFDQTGSDDPDYVTQKIMEGLQANGLIKNEDTEKDEYLAA